jgi:hypothetical protein
MRGGRVAGHPPALPVGSPEARFARTPTPRHRQRRLLRRRNDSGASSPSRGGGEAAGGGGGGERGGEGAGGGAAIAETPAGGRREPRAEDTARRQALSKWSLPFAARSGGGRGLAPGTPSASRVPHFGDTPPGGRGRRAVRASGRRRRPWRGVGSAGAEVSPLSPPCSRGQPRPGELLPRAVLGSGRRWAMGREGWVLDRGAREGSRNAAPREGAAGASSSGVLALQLP